MRLIIFTFLLASATASQAALQPACAAVIKEHAEILVVESTLFRKDMEREVGYAEHTGDKTAVLLFALALGPTSHAVRFEKALGKLIAEKRLSGGEEFVLQRVCDRNLQMTLDVFNY